MTEKFIRSLNGYPLRDEHAQGRIDGLDSKKLDADKLPEATNAALAQAKASGEFDGKPGANGRTPIAGIDYYTDADKAEFSGYIATELAKRGQLKPEFANNTEECADTSKLYVLPDGYIYAYVSIVTEGGATANFDNVLDRATIRKGERYSLSGGSFKTQSGCDSIIVPIPSGTVEVHLRGITLNSGYTNVYGGTSTEAFTGELVNLAAQYNNIYTDANGDKYFTCTNSGGYTYMVFFVTQSGTDYDNGAIAINELISYTTTEGGIVRKWANTGHAFVPADYEDRIVAAERNIGKLDTRVKTLEESEPVMPAAAISMMIYAPSPQLPADGSETADFDAANINANEIYAYIDTLVEKHPRYLTKETLGKDESGAYDWNRYTVSRRTYDAWVNPAYPAMYAWVNDSTTIYSASVSPRVGDTMYTTAYIGTTYSTVTAVDTPNQTRTVGGKVYSRDKSKDVAPTLVYTLTDYDSRRLGIYTTWHNGVYNASRSKIGTISSIADGALTDSNGKTYKRYPMGDRNHNFAKLPVLVIGSNEHGGTDTDGGDPSEPAIITARLIKDLCECKNADNPMINTLKSEYMIVFCPVINPYGYGKQNGYCNANGVNIDRNFDTPGWGNDSDQRHGDYGGSENETQYFMNTLIESGTKIALANHGFGPHVGTEGEAVCAGFCGYMLGRDNPKYSAYLAAIAETMSVNYDLTTNNVGQAPGDAYGKTRSYMDHVGIEGGALEMSAIEGYLLHGGALHTAKVLESDYTFLLQFLKMLIDCQ